MMVGFTHRPWGKPGPVATGSSGVIPGFPNPYYNF